MKFTEWLGRFFFERNKPWILILLLCLPFGCTMCMLLCKFHQLRELECAFDTAALKGRFALEKRAQKERFLSRYMETEPYFIHQTLETLPLCQKELAALKIHSTHPACPDRENKAKRIAFLESPQNRLTFAEEQLNASPRTKETVERLLFPVEIDGNDLENLLALVEEIPIGSYYPQPNSPQLMIRDFSLLKKDCSLYELNLSLIKREFYEKKNPS